MYCYSFDWRGILLGHVSCLADRLTLCGAVDVLFPCSGCTVVGIQRFVVARQRHVDVLVTKPRPALASRSTTRPRSPHAGT